MSDVTKKSPTGIFPAIAAIMKDVCAIEKDRKNEKQNYKFRGIDDVYNELHPLLAKYEVFTTSAIVEESSEERTSAGGGHLIYRKIRMQYIFHHSDGSSITTEVMGEGMDSGDKASNKAMAVAHKYALTQMFAIPTDGAKDPENDSPAVAPRQQPSNPSPNRTETQPASAPAQERQPGEEGDEEPLKPLREINQQMNQGPAPARPLSDAERKKLGKIDHKQFAQLGNALKAEKIPADAWKAWLKDVYGFAGLADTSADAFAGIYEIVAHHKDQIINYKGSAA